MKPFVVWVNIVGGTLVWFIVSAVLFFYLSFPNHSTGTIPPIWPRIILVAISICTWMLMILHYFRKLKR